MSQGIFPSFLAMQQKAQSQQPIWLKALATLAAEGFSKTGLPTRQDEEWKYTDLAFIKDFSGGVAEQDIKLGVSFAELGSQDISDWEGLRQRLNSWVQNSSLENLNLALNTGGQFIRVPKNQKINLSFALTSVAGNSWLSPRIAIFLESHSEATIFEESLLKENELLNGVVDVHLAEGAKLNYVRLQNNHLRSNSLSTLRVWQKRDSTLNYKNFVFGSQTGRDNVLTYLEGENAHCNLQGLAMVRPGQHLDQFVFVDHATPRAQSHQLFKNIVSNKSRAVFNGRIMVREGSVGTDARQLNRNLLLGRSAEVDTRPQLEIFNDDVKCSHGATIGRLNPEEVFYLESRAISRSVAINMLCRAFVEEMVLTIESQEQQAKVMAALQNHFDQLESDYV